MKKGSLFLTLLLVLLTACGTVSTAIQSTRPASTRRPTFTPLVVKTPVPLPTKTFPTIAPLTEGRHATIAFSGPDPSKKPLQFILVQHAGCTWDQFWCPVEQGIRDAAREMNVTVTILTPDALDLNKTAAQIDEAVAAQPDGIALTVSDPQVLHDSIMRAIRTGIPVIAYNAGTGPLQDNLPYLTYLGMDNYRGGYLGAYRLIKAGARMGVCINHAPNLLALQTRCKGFQNAFAENGLKVELLNTAMDPGQASKDIRAYAQAHPEANAYLTNGPASAQAFYAYLQTAGGETGEILHGTFDLSPVITANIKNGTTLFGIDQQPYLQGYEAVYWLTMINRYGLKPVLPVIATGPGFVDKDNVDAKTDPGRPVKLILVHHGLCTWDAYWCVIDQGAYDAARNMHVQLTILGPERFDLKLMAAKVGEAVAAQPDGIAVTVPDPTILHEPILRAIKAGYPVVAFDTGAGPVKDNLPYLTFLGQDEYQGGYLGALRLIGAGARAGVCVNQQMGHVALDARCQGFIDAFANKGLAAQMLDCSGDPVQALKIIQDFAQAHPEVNAFLTLGAENPGAVSFYDFLRASGRIAGEVLHGTFDLSLAVAAAIENGTTLFAIDAQPYLQGYGAVMFLTLYLRQNIRPALPITPTGPGFVDRDNIALYKQLVGKYR